MPDIKTNKAGFVKQEDGLIRNDNMNDLEKYRLRLKEIQRDQMREKKQNQIENRISTLEQKLDLILEKLSNG